jgi:hypothetical protein
MKRHWLAFALSFGFIAAGSTQAAEMSINSSQWDSSLHLDVLRYRSEDIAGAYLSGVSSLPEPEKLTLLSYDKCAGHIERPPRVLSSGYIECRRVTLVFAKEIQVPAGRAERLMDWRDSFASNRNDGSIGASAP